MVFRKLVVFWRPVTPSIIGLCLGITISLIYAPFLEEGCSALFDNKRPVKLRETKSLREVLPDRTENFGDENKIEPRLKLQAKPPPAETNQVKVHKLVRPRYISTELGIREKIFVAVLTSSESLGTLAVAFNKTVAQHVTKTVFFTDISSPGGYPPAMVVVGLPADRPEHLPLHVLKYLREHYTATFDYYMLVSDRTYLRGEKVFDLVSEISVSEDVHMGAKPKTGHHCTLDGGIILSQSILAKAVSKLDQCFKNGKSKSADYNLGNCIVHSSGLNCKNTAGDDVFRYYHVTDFNYDDIKIVQKPQLKEAVSFYPMPDDISVYKLHRFFCQLDLNATWLEIERTKEEILYLSQFAPGGRASLSWPIAPQKDNDGLPEPFKPRNRFDMIHWQYFTEKKLYFDSDYSNEKDLKGINKIDVDEVLKVSVQKLNKQYDNKYVFSKLLNGYRRFDPTRGMEYILDLVLKDKTSNKKEVEKRVHLVRPLGQVEIIPMPYVTENSKVNLILPVTEEDKDEFGSFLDMYAHTCLDTGDNTHLLIVFIYKNNSKALKDDKFYVLKSMITYYENKYQNKGKIAWTALNTKSTYISDVSIMDGITKRFSKDALLLLCSVGMELTTEFFNRVRMNTIQGWQVFSPVGFWQYKPNLIYNRRPYPTNIEINRNVGHFDIYSFEHIGFYNSDFSESRKLLAGDESKKTELFKMFIKYQKLHVFRAIEPTLKHRYKAINCDASSPATIYHRCSKRRLEVLATRAQLARLIFTYQEKMEALKKQKSQPKKSPIK